MTTQTLDTVLRIFRHYKLLSTNQTLIVGVSGGMDSLALLHILIQLQHELKIRLHVATLNHGIRGDSGASDAEFVGQMATKWRIPYTQGYIDVPLLAKDEQIGVEAAARKARYRFLSQVAREQNAETVAVAHHANDQAETILMHIIRGSGLNGLLGMQFVSPMPNNPALRLIRPLLKLQRTDLEQYCLQNDLRFRHDKTNDDTDYQRNYIRHEIMPRLNTVNPNVVGALLRLSDNVRVDEMYLDQQAVQFIEDNVEEADNFWCVNLKVLSQQPLAIQRRFIMKAFNKLTDEVNSISSDHVTALISWMDGANVGSQLDLGQGIQSRMGYELLYIETKNYLPSYKNYALIPEGTNKTIIHSESQSGTYNVNIEKQYGLQIGVADNLSSVDEQSVVIVYPQDAIVRLRTRVNGDRFRPKGMKGRSRKLKDWMIDRKIPRQIRDNIPLITINEEIMAICVGKTWHLANSPQDYLNEKTLFYLMLR